MSEFGELEIWIDRQGQEQPTAQLRFRQAGSEDDRVTPATSFDLDLEALSGLELQPGKYGEALARALAVEPLAAELEQARAVCESGGVPLRVRLFLGPGAQELHALRWETMGDPRNPTTSWLSQQDVFFSRYLSSFDWRPVLLKPRTELSALVVIANPSDLGDYPDLAPVDIPGAEARIKEALGGIPATVLAGGGKATLSGLFQSLSRGFDILYLMAHGMLVRGRPFLFLEKEDGATDRVEADALVARIKELANPPGMAVLASCQSAGTGQAQERDDWGPLSAVGPRLSAAGVPAVLAMQGSVSMETEAAYMSSFFEELSGDGQVDRAASVARSGVRERPDWWMPVLFSRLRRGRIWYQAGFSGDGDAKDKWPAVVRHVQKSRGGGDGAAAGRASRRRRRLKQQGGCTPLLGPGLLEPYVGRLQEIATKWAEDQHYPMAPHETEQLARIAQFIDVKIEHRHLHRELERHLCRQLVARHGSVLPADLVAEAEEDPLLADLLTEAVAVRKEDPRVTEAHHALADLNLPIYLTTNPDSVLVDLLEERGKEVMVDICRWNADLVHGEEQVFEPLGDERPTPDKPLVYHLFGHLDDPRSLVLSEDDHFDFLSGFVRYKDHVPSVVRAALSTTSLLFVGFRLDDWSFRVLFRGIMNQEGAGLAARLSHIAAQIEPEEGRLLDPAGTREFLRKYVGTANISLYWGNAENFLGDLLQQLSS